MSRNRATAKQRKQQQYRYGYRAKQGETAPEESETLDTSPRKLEEDAKVIEQTIKQGQDKADQTRE